MSESRDLNLNINLDSTPVLYTDTVFMTVNQDGVVFDVCQKVGNTNQLRVVSRIGMSKEHAKKFVSQLSQLMVQSESQGKVQFNRTDTKN